MRELRLSNVGPRDSIARTRKISVVGQEFMEHDRDTEYLWNPMGLEVLEARMRQVYQ